MQPQTKDDAAIKARRTRGFKPQAEGNSSSKGSVKHACETGKPQQDSSPNLPKPSPVKVPNVAFWRPKETERWCNATTKIKARRTRGFKPQAESNSSSKGSVGHASETGKPQQDSSPNLPKPSPVKLPNVAFYGLKKQKDDAMQPQTKDDATTKIKARRTRGFKPQAEADSSSKGSVGHASETGKPQQDSSPNLPKPSPVKLPNVAFWRPKETERWCNATTNKRWCNHQDQGPKNAIFRQKNCLTSLSERRWNSTMERSKDETVPHSLLWRAPPEAAGSADFSRLVFRWGWTLFQAWNGPPSKVNFQAGNPQPIHEWHRQPTHPVPNKSCLNSHRIHVWYIYPQKKSYLQ